jgi:AraC family transcriptional regulator
MVRIGNAMLSEQQRLNCSRLHPRARLLAHDGELVAALRHYDSASAQDSHFHEAAQLSFLLVGSLHESHARRDYEAQGGWVGFKPAGCRHANRFGRDGALLLTIETRGSHQVDPGWSPSEAQAQVPQLTRLALDGGGGAVSLDAIHDLVAIAATQPCLISKFVPPELEAARERLHDEPEGCRIDVVASDSGFERTFFAHLFRRHFGAPPSVYRARRMTAKATRALLSDPGATVADAAFAAGFADHSHYTKTLRRFTGLTPRKLRSALS